MTTPPDPPKSSFDIVMERLRQKDAASGEEQKALTDEQRTKIADVRSMYEAQVAERKIMHQSAVVNVFDPQVLEERSLELRRDLERFERERDEKITRIRDGRA